MQDVLRKRRREPVRADAYRIEPVATVEAQHERPFLFRQRVGEWAFRV